MKNIQTFQSNIKIIYRDSFTHYLVDGVLLNQGAILLGTTSPLCWYLRKEAQWGKVAMKCNGNLVTPIVGNWIGDPVSNAIAKDYVEWKEKVVTCDNETHRRLVLRNYKDGSALVYDRNRPDLVVNDFVASLRTAKERIGYPAGYILLKDIDTDLEMMFDFAIKLKCPDHGITDKTSWKRL